MWEEEKWRIRKEEYKKDLAIKLKVRDKEKEKKRIDDE